MAICATRGATAGRLGVAEVERIAASHTRRALRLAGSILGDAELARDAVQEALVRLLDRARSFRGEALVETYFYRVVVNECLGVLRRQRVRSWLLGRWARTIEPTHEPTPEVAVERELRLARLRVAITRLPPTQRVAFVLRHVEGSTVAEVAAAMRIAESTVKTHLQRALARVRFEMAEDRGRR